MAAKRALRLAAVAPATSAKYLAAVRYFVKYCNDMDDAPDDYDAFDDCLAEYIQHLYDAGASFDRAEKTVFGLCHFLPRLSHHLFLSRRVLKGWRNLAPVQSHPPLTWELAQLFALTMANLGFYEAGVATLVAFDCYLRISEFCALRAVDVAIPGDAKLPSAYKKVALRLPSTKTGKNQFVCLNRAPVASFLADLASAATDKSAPLFCMSTWRYRQLFARVSSALGLASIRFSPHSLRHGGATTDFLLGATVDTVLLRGRWAAAKSARIYIQSGPALLIAFELPEHVRVLVDRVPPLLVRALRALRATHSR